MKDKKFLQWFHNRMIEQHGENENVDYMHKFRAVIASIDESVETANVCSTFESKPEIKPIDSYDFSDSDIHNNLSAEIDENGLVEFIVHSDDGGPNLFRLNDDDLAVIANARGFELVKR